MSTRTVVIVILSAVCVGGVSSALYYGLRPHEHELELPPLPPELEPLRQTKVDPDPFGEFESVIASLKDDDLRVVVLHTYRKDPVAAYLKARSWAMTKDNMIGATGEVEPFLKALETPLAVLPEADPLDLEPQQQPDERRRCASMYGLAKAVIGGLAYDDAVVDRMESAATVNMDVCRHNATVVLLLLSERRTLSVAAAEALARSLEQPAVNFYEHLRTQQQDYALGKQG